VVNDSYLLMSIPFVLSTAIYLFISGYRNRAEERLMRKKIKQLSRLQVNTPGDASLTK